MSIQPHPENDLDRTDELPRLDVEAYEAATAAESSSLSSTDTWNVQALRDLHDEDEADGRKGSGSTTVQLRRPSTFAGANKSASNDVTLDAGRILSRIGQLESELSAVKGHSREFQERAEALAGDLAGRDKRVAALEADNERLREQQSLAFGKIQSLEAQLSSQAASFDGALKDSQDARDALAAAASANKAALEQRVSSLQAQITTLQADREQLRGELRNEAVLAQSRGESLQQVRQALAEEQHKTAQMARYLAGKVAEYDTMSAALAAREQSIDALELMRDELATQLSAAQEQSTQRLEALETAQRTLEALRAEHGEQQRAMQERDRRITQLTADLERTVADFGATLEQRNAGLNDLAAERKEHEQTRRALAQRETQIERLQKDGEAAAARIDSVDVELRIITATAAQQRTEISELERQLGDGQRQVEALSQELAAARERIGTLDAELQSLSGLREELTASAAQLERTQQQAMQLDTQILELRTAGEKYATLTSEREAELQAAQQELAQAQQTSASLQQSLAGATASLARLEGEISQQALKLQGLTEQYDKARNELERQSPTIQELEQAVRARDALTHDLRGELQAAHDERALMEGHLDKARARNKTLAREVFQRDKYIATLKQDLAVHAETLAAIRQDVNRVGAPDPSFSPEEPERVLEPIGHDGPTVVLNRKVVTLGRTSDNDACIPSKLVSRHHARLLVGPNAVIVEDAGSTNGCYVNDKLVKQQLMRDGDVLGLGDLRYRLATRAPRATRLRDNVISIVETPQSDG